MRSIILLIIAATVSSQYLVVRALHYSSGQYQKDELKTCRVTKSACPQIPLAKNFDMDEHLGQWYVIESSLDIPDCSFAMRSNPKPKPKVVYRKRVIPYYYKQHGPHGVHGQYASASYLVPTYEYDYHQPKGGQTLTVAYLDKETKKVKVMYSGETSMVPYSGASFTNTFSSGSVSDVRVVYADYDPTCGHMLMVTCTTKSNGDFEVNANILARTNFLDPVYLKKLHDILTKHGNTELEAKLKPKKQSDCQPEQEVRYAKVQRSLPPITIINDYKKAKA